MAQNMVNKGVNLFSLLVEVIWEKRVKRFHFLIFEKKGFLSKG
jgi:hypothetical protein